MSNEFNREFLGSFPAWTEEEIAAFRAWKQYFIETELYGRSICMQRDSTGTAIPQGAEVNISNRFALEKRKQLIDPYGFDDIRFRKFRDAANDEADLELRNL